MKQKRVTITQKQRHRFKAIGDKLMKERLTSGYQLEDFPKKEPKMIFGHDNPRHIRFVQRKIGGRIYPRESRYVFDEAWEAGTNTAITSESIGEGKEEYIATKNLKNAQIIEEKLVKRSKKGYPKVYWVVPDVRIFGEETHPNFRRAWQVTKGIDANSRLSMVIVRKAKLKKVRRELKGERVKGVLVQDYKPKKHSFFDYIFRKG